MKKKKTDYLFMLFCVFEIIFLTNQLINFRTENFLAYIVFALFILGLVLCFVEALISKCKELF